MRPLKKIYPTELDVLQTKTPKYKVKSFVYHSDTAIKEWIELNDLTATNVHSDLIRVISVDELLKFLNS